MARERLVCDVSCLGNEFPALLQSRPDLKLKETSRVGAPAPPDPPLRDSSWASGSNPTFLIDDPLPSARANKTVCSRSLRFLGGYWIHFDFTLETLDNRTNACNACNVLNREQNTTQSSEQQKV